MNKILLTMLLAMTICIAKAGTLTSEGPRSDRKILEITKIVKLSPKQEQEIRKAYDMYNYNVDSALYKITNAKEAACVKYEAGKDFNKALMSICLLYTSPSPRDSR